MPSPEARADSLAARFDAAGLAPRTHDHPRHLSIEADVPDSVTSELWQEVLSLLESADWFGLMDSSARGRTVWAAIRKDSPATCAAGEHGLPP